METGTETLTPVVPAVVDNSAELAALKASNAELTRAAEFWQSRAIPPPAPAAAPVPEAEPEDETDILDLLATKGAKGLDAFMRKRGYVSQKEVDASVSSQVAAKGAQLSTEAELLGNYPDLKDKNSDFFKATASNYGELLKQGVSEPLAMKLGAQQAELQGFRSGKVKSATQIAADTAATKETNRLARIKAQGGDRSTRAAEVDDDDTLSDNDMAAVRQLADGLDIPYAEAEKRYIARAKGGVNVALKLDRGGR